jgi:hypothetical protein
MRLISTKARQVLPCRTHPFHLNQPEVRQFGMKNARKNALRQMLAQGEILRIMVSRLE